MADLRVIVECLRVAHYSEVEIVDYLEHVLGIAAADAARVVNEA